MDAGLSSFISLFGGWQSSEMAGQQAELSLVRSTLMLATWLVNSRRPSADYWPSWANGSTLWT